MALGVSVIICCYNSAERLPQTLRHLARQEVSAAINWEVIVVDNASTDNTLSIAKTEWEKCDTPNIGWKIIREPIPGKNMALATGIRESQYDFLIICDDDNWLYPNYVQTAFDLINADDLIAIVGGCGIFEPEKPVNNDIENLEKYYINGSQYWVDEQHWVYGAGAVYRKSVFSIFADKKIQLITPGRVGNKLNGGEDAELCLMAHLQGYKIIASDNLKFKHFVPLKRQNLAYILNMQYWMGYSNVLLYSYFAITTKAEKPIEYVVKKWLGDISKKVFKQALLLTFNSIKNQKKPTLEQQLSFKSNLGTFNALLRNSQKVIKHHYAIINALSNESSHSTLTVKV